MELKTNDIGIIMIFSLVANVIFSFFFLFQGTQEYEVKQEKIYVTSSDLEVNDSVDLSNEQNEQGQESENGEIIAEEMPQENPGIVEDYIKEADLAVLEMLSDFIVGTYKVGNKMFYNFGLNGFYSGFFDSTHQNVTGYSYEIRVNDGEAVLNIYNEDKSAVVSYQLFMQGTTKLMLYYKDLDLKIILEK